MLIAGIDISEKERTGSFILEDNTVVHAHAFQEGLEVLGTGAALKKYDWLQDYYWNLIEPDMDKFTETAETDREGGYFIRTARSQSCLSNPGLYVYRAGRFAPECA